MKLKKFFVAVVALLCAVSVSAQTSQRIAVPTSVEKWITSTFAKGKTPPFSFVYDGVNSQQFIRKWQHSLQMQESAEGVVKYVATYLDRATGLKIECHIKGFQEFGAVEWMMNFTNTGSQNTPQITQVKTVDYSALSQ